MKDQMKQFPIEDDANGAAAAGIDVDGPLEDDRLDGDQLDEAVDEGWRIDDLAQRAAVAVDTIRYYQREGLLPSGERNGRTRRFGPEHLERLERIRALQSRRFSLAAIHALLERDDPGALAGLLIGSEEATYDHDELLAAAGVDASLVRDLT
ncbi:MAG: MerR family transcriptional regulator, partial [Acidimicrobiia bacterium]